MDTGVGHSRVREAEGIVQALDLAGRELKVLVDGAVVVFDIPPQCPIFLHDERVKLRLVQPLDSVQIEYQQMRDARVAESIRDSGGTRLVVAGFSRHEEPGPDRSGHGEPQRGLAKRSDE